MGDEPAERGVTGAAGVEPRRPNDSDARDLGRPVFLSPGPLPNLGRYAAGPRQAAGRCGGPTAVHDRDAGWAAATYLRDRSRLLLGGDGQPVRGGAAVPEVGDKGSLAVYSAIRLLSGP